MLATSNQIVLAHVLEEEQRCTTKGETPPSASEGKIPPCSVLLSSLGDPTEEPLRDFRRLLSRRGLLQRQCKTPFFFERKGPERKPGPGGSL